MSEGNGEREREREREEWHACHGGRECVAGRRAVRQKARKEKDG